MPTVRQYISDLTNTIKATNSDDWVSPKWLYLKSQSVISDFLRKDSRDGQMFKLRAGWSELSCIEMIEVPATECDIPVYLCQKLMRSKYKIPELYETKTGALLKQASSVDWSNSYNPIFSPRLWVAAQKREFKSKKYYIFLDGYIYIPISKMTDAAPTTIRVEGYFKNKKEVDEFNSKQGCGSCKRDTPVCTSVLDYDMVCPDFLLNSVKTEVLNQVMNTYERISQDELPNQNTLEKTNNKNTG